LYLENKYFVKEVEHEDPLSQNFAVYYHFQCGASDEILDAKVHTVAHILSEPAFDVLRTKQQLGVSARV
jgi:secreted Zn-dependent insulinase-like peptidase